MSAPGKQERKPAVRRGRKLALYAVPVGVAAVIAVAMWMYFAGVGDSGKTQIVKLHMGKDTVTYGYGGLVTDSDAETLARSLKSTGYFTNAGLDVRYSKTAEQKIVSGACQRL